MLAVVVKHDTVDGRGCGCDVEVSALVPVLVMACARVGGQWTVW
jgi:hypothetical protein